MAKHRANLPGSAGAPSHTSRVGDGPPPSPPFSPRTNGYGAARSRLRTNSALLDRQAFANMAGLQFEGLRDLYLSLGYDKTLTPEKYRAKYERGGIAKRIVQALPKATWRGGGELIEDEDPDTETTFEAAWNGIADRLQVWPTFQRADILAGLGRYSVILIGAAGEPNLAVELPRGSSPDAVLYLKPYDEMTAVLNAEDFDTEPSSPRYGLPKQYTLTLRRATGSGTAKVHWSRILHVAEDQLDDSLFGEPRLRAVWNYLIDLEKVHGSGAEAFWQRVNPLFQAKFDEELPTDEQALQDVEDEITEGVHGQRRWVGTRGLELEQFQTQVASIGPNVDALLMLISATTGIPHRILTGSERGELASSQDKNNWNERVSDRRDAFAAPAVVRPLVDRLVAYGYLPKPAKPYRVAWPELKESEPTELMAIALQMAEVNQKNGLTYVRDEIRATTEHPAFEEVASDAEMESGADAGDEEDDALEIEGDEDEEDLRTAATLLFAGAKWSGQEMRGAHGHVHGLRAAADFVSKEPNEPAWKAIHRAADRNRARVARLFERAFATAARALKPSALEAAFSARDRDTAQRLAREAVAAGDEALEETLAEALFETLVAGGREAAKQTRKQGRFAKSRTADETPDAEPDDSLFSIAFDDENPAATRWAATRAATLIVEVSQETRAAIRELIAAAFEEGIAPREAAREIRKLVGLNSLQARAVQNLRDEIRAAKPGDVITRAGGKFRIKVPTSGITSSFVRARVAKYSERMHRLRALNIARTETLAASNEGQRQLWLQARLDGLLDAGVRRAWLTTSDDRVCPICLGLDGEKVGLDENFSIGVLGPPAHTDCRCATSLVEDD